MRWVTYGPALALVGLLGCSDDGEPGDGAPGETAAGTSTESGDGDGGSDPGDGDGDGDPGDGDGDGDGDGEPGDGDGDPVTCDPTAFLGFGLAEDGWGLGDGCDSVHVCASDSTQTQALLELGAVCAPSEPGCADDQMQCTLSSATTVDQAVIDQACTALEIPGVEAVYCAIWGP